MKKDYFHFKNGDYIVCIKEASCVFSKILKPDTEGINLELCKTYIVDKYLVGHDGRKMYDALVLKGYTPLHDGKNFMLLSEFRKIKLNRLKRKLFFKKYFGKLVLLK